MKLLAYAHPDLAGTRVAVSCCSRLVYGRDVVFEAATPREVRGGKAPWRYECASCPAPEAPAIGEIAFEGELF